MSSEFTISERLSSAGKEQMFANNCLKRKLEVVGRNGFSATEHDMTFQDHDCSLRIEVGSFNFENNLENIKILFTRYLSAARSPQNHDRLIF